MEATLEETPLLTMRREWREIFDRDQAARRQTPPDYSWLSQGTCARIDLQNPRNQRDPGLAERFRKAVTAIKTTQAEIERTTAAKQLLERNIEICQAGIDEDRRAHGVLSLRRMFPSVFTPSSAATQAIAHYKKQLPQTDARLEELMATKAGHQHELDAVLELMLVP